MGLGFMPISIGRPMVKKLHLLIMVVACMLQILPRVKQLRLMKMRIMFPVHSETCLGAGLPMAITLLTPPLPQPIFSGHGCIPYLQPNLMHLQMLRQMLPSLRLILPGSTFICLQVQMQARW